MPRVLMLFNKPRAGLIAASGAGQCPDELLYGMKTLGERGWQVEVSDAGFADFPGGRILKGLDDFLSRGGRRTGFHVKQAWRLRREIEKADVVFATADSSGLPVLALKALGLVHTPVLYASIGLAETFGDPAGLVYALYRLCLQKAERILTYSVAETEELSRKFGLERERVHFVPFGVETNFFQHESIAGKGRPLAFGLDHRRDWPTFFAAAAGAPANFELLANPDVLRGLAAPRNVMLLPPEPIEALRRRLLAAPFVVLPVRENGYSGGTISLLQSMAAGKAAIVSRTQAIADGYGLVDGENCLLTPPGDVPAMARAISRLLGDPALVVRLGESAAAHVRVGYDIDRLDGDLDRLLREAMP